MFNSMNISDNSKSSDSDLDEYRQSLYLPLDSRRREFRVLFLRPGDFETDDEIHLSLTTTSVDSPIPFRAISYTRGTHSSRKSVFVNDLPFVVTESQYSVLRRLRDSEEPTIWWLDAICINQDDPIEKAEQVGIMHEIYEKSLETQIWLGEPDSTWIGYLPGDELQDLFNKFMVHSDMVPRKELERYEGSREYYQQLLSKEGSDTQSAIEGAVTLAKVLASRPNLLELPFYYTRDTGSLSPHWQWYFHFGTFAHITTRPWWSRLWVAQEVLFGKALPVLHLGSLTVPLRVFTDALNYLQIVHEHASSDELTLLDWCTHTRPDIPFDVSTCGELLPRWIKIYKRQNYTLENLLGMSGSMKVSNPRDRIFALSGFQDSTLRVPISYTLPTSWLYPYVTWRLCVARNNLDWLAQFRLRSHSDTHTNLPSWITDFDDPSSNHVLSFGPNIVYDEPDWALTTMSTDERIQVVANPLERISTCIDPFWTESDTLGKNKAGPARSDSYTDLDDTGAILLAPALREAQMSGFSQRDFFQTLLGDMSIVPRQLRDSKTQREIIDLCSRVLRSEMKRSSPSESTFNSRERMSLRALKNQLRVAQMFITSEWKLGIGPVTAQVGDMLYHVHGCAAPLILRSVQPNSLGAGGDIGECYNVVGAAYVEGLVGAAVANNGQARVIQLV